MEVESTRRLHATNLSDSDIGTQDLDMLVLYYEIDDEQGSNQGNAYDRY